MSIKKISAFVILWMMLALFPLSAHADENIATWVGSNTCKECHEEAYNNFSKDRHGAAKDPNSPASQTGCESCHGPGSIHAESEDPKDIITWTSKTENTHQQNNLCLSCHFKGKTALWTGSSHESRGLSCKNCHKIHSNPTEHLLVNDEVSTCNTCHKRIRAEMVRQSHHPIKENKMSCSDCHNAHGTVADKLVDAQTVNSKCYECHSEKRGPYLWEHMPVVENCLTCHTPHGSSRSGLLNAKMPYICQRCHGNDGHAGELWAKRTGQEGLTVYQASSNRLFYRSCINCHSRIHGSNHPSGKLLQR